MGKLEASEAVFQSLVLLKNNKQAFAKEEMPRKSGLKKNMNHCQQKGRREKTGMTYEVRRICLRT